jgi:hypothetical protein
MHCTVNDFTWGPESDRILVAFDDGHLCEVMAPEQSDAVGGGDSSDSFRLDLNYRMVTLEIYVPP